MKPTRQQEFISKNVLVMGAGISGIAVALILQKLGASVTLSDAKTKEQLKKDLSQLTSAGVKLILGPQNNSLLEKIDYIVMSPGISIYIPLVKEAKARGITVISEIEVAYLLCPTEEIIAVTGTNGKTTTTTLIGEMLKQAAKEVVVGGNIGFALSEEVSGISAEGIVVAEISSFQLEGIIDFHPHIAAILNVTPDHLDRHGSMENYIYTKEQIFVNQTAEDYLILNYDDEAVRAMAARAKSKVLFFTRRKVLDEGIYLQDGQIKISWQGQTTTIVSIADMQIKGMHNVENAMAACAAAFFAGLNFSDITKVLCEFGGVEHRIEPVAVINQVAYYNDSKATNPESSIKALEAFDGHIILIAGGRDKNTDLTEFMKLIQAKAEHLILLGEAAERFSAAAKKQGIKNIHQVDSMASAVNLAHKLARNKEVVLLSPACSSYDMFKNYEERGKAFKELVKALK
ncbi:MAG: UDP-N-acetylmuramoyl-L-alanine--D-glutamate ligase [Pelosinus sp.]|nr:UDP-N-acetylmuramoyl-L-alanine--D-glutamate ligase [Pelosinus sp.]